MKRSLIAVAIVGCQGPAEMPSMPWLYGLEHPVVNTTASDVVAQQIEQHTDLAPVDDDCSAGFYPGIAIKADVAQNPGDETVMASLAHGIVVLDSEDHLVTETAGYPCSGSGDELVAVGAGDVYGVPLIAIAATTGGFREGSTWISLLRVGPDSRLDATFTGTVELRSGDQVKQGALVLLPGALVYLHPAGTPQLMIYNPVVRAYLRPGEPFDDRPDANPSEILAEGQP